MKIKNKLVTNIIMTHMDSQPEMQKEEDTISILSFSSYDSEATISECADTVPVLDMISQQNVTSRSSSPNSWILESITDYDSFTQEQAHKEELDSMCSVTLHVTDENRHSTSPEKVFHPIQLQQLFDIVVSDGKEEKQELDENDDSVVPLPILQKDLDTLVENQHESGPVQKNTMDVFADINEYESESDTEPLHVESDTSLEITNLINYIYENLTYKYHNTIEKQKKSTTVTHRPMTRSMTSQLNPSIRSIKHQVEKNQRPVTRSTKNKVRNDTSKNKVRNDKKIKVKKQQPIPFTMVLRNRSK
jgi:hypothetical protein